MDMAKRFEVEAVEIRPGVRTLPFVAASEEMAKAEVERVVREYKVEAPRIAVR